MKLELLVTYNPFALRPGVHRFLMWRSQNWWSRHLLSKVQFSSPGRNPKSCPGLQPLNHLFLCKIPDLFEITDWENSVFYNPTPSLPFYYHLPFNYLPSVFPFLWIQTRNCSFAFPSLFFHPRVFLAPDFQVSLWQWQASEVSVWEHDAKTLELCLLADNT